jgi:hypothetical protein
VHPLVDVVQDQHVRPRMLQKLHLVVNLWNKKTKTL